MLLCCCFINLLFDLLKCILFCYYLVIFILWTSIIILEQSLTILFRSFSLYFFLYLFYFLKKFLYLFKSCELISKSCRFFKIFFCRFYTFNWWSFWHRPCKNLLRCLKVSLLYFRFLRINRIVVYFSTEY